MTVYRMVRLDKMREEGLTGDEIVDALTLAINDLGIVMGLKIIHGDRAVDVYLAHGGMVRFDDDGHVLVPVKVNLTDGEAATQFTACGYCGAPRGVRCIAVHRYAPHGERRPALRPHAERIHAWRKETEREDPAS